VFFWLGFWARWGARFLLDFFVPGVARPWRRAASRWVCGWAMAWVVRDRGVAAILRGVCRCACRAVARGCAWRGRFAFSTGRGAGAALLAARFFASLRFEKKLFFLGGDAFFSFRFFFLACARVRFFFDVRFSLRRSVRCCFA
jgi:hypothetical protein